MAESTTRSAKHEVARESVPKELLDQFDTMVEDYRGAAFKHHKIPFVSYIVLAEMLSLGWRKTAKLEETRNGDNGSADKV